MLRANPFRLRFATGMFCKSSGKYARNVLSNKFFVGLHGDKTHNTFFVETPQFNTAKLSIRREARIFIRVMKILLLLTTRC
jgi:hypothetical protein